jgi:enoyl-CoA hydratase/carnithine racemase
MTDTTAASAPPEVLYTVSEQIAVITLNAPARMNTISREMLGDLTQRLLQANADKDVRCVILTGTGRAFCAGLDLNTQRGDGGISNA